MARSLRTTSQSSTQLTPYELAFGHTPRLIQDLDRDQQDVDPSERLLVPRDKLEKYKKVAREKIRDAQRRQQRAHARKGGRRTAKVGDLVMARKRPRDRHDISVDGPYKVTMVDEIRYRLRVEGCPRGQWVALSDATPYREAA